MSKFNRVIEVNMSSVKKINSILGLLLLVGCSSEHISHDDEIVPRNQRKYQGFGKFFGEEPLLFGGDREGRKADVGIGVNSYLWRATLDTLAFMPLKSVDPFGGVIITKWYAPPSTPNERLKVDVRILDRVLRADGLTISVFRQVLKQGRWVDAVVNPKTAQDLEDAILTRARQLKADAGR
jgi:Domain of unknown function (DUF3576).